MVDRGSLPGHPVRVAAVACLALTIATTHASPAGNTPRPTAPGWVNAIPPGTWAEISKNRLQDVDPAADPRVNPNYPSAPPWRGVSGQKAVLNAWNGGAYASRFGRYGALVVFGGGHSDYFGNEVYAFDLATRVWTRITNPYAAQREVLTAFHEGAAFPDGSPLPPHTYDYLEYDPTTNSLLILKGVQQLNVSGGSKTASPAYALSLDDLSWRRTAIAPAVYGSSGWSAYDSKRGVFWINPPRNTPQAGFRYLDVSGRNEDGSIGQWSDAFGPRKTGGGDGMGAYDPANDILVYSDFRAEQPKAYAVDLQRPERPAVPLVMMDAPADLRSAHGWEWSSLRKAFVYWPRTAGAAVHEFRLVGSDWREGPWAWKEITSPANQLVPARMTAENGVFGRFRVVTFADAEIAVTVTRVDGPVYAFRVPAGAGNEDARSSHRPATSSAPRISGLVSHITENRLGIMRADSLSSLAGLPEHLEQ